MEQETELASLLGHFLMCSRGLLRGQPKLFTCFVCIFSKLVTRVLTFTWEYLNAKLRALLSVTVNYALFFNKHLERFDFVMRLKRCAHFLGQHEYLQCFQLR